MKVKIGSFLFRYRNVVGPVLFLLALLIERPTYSFDRPDLDILFDVVGITCALLGQTLRIVTVGYEYIERGGRNRQVYASRLVQGGVFGHCRNPLYIGNILIALGFALIVNSYLFYLIVVPFIVFSYSSIVATEEAFLSQKFGAEYEQYCRRVNRWWPRLQGWKHSTAGMQFNWRRVLVKEYNTIFVMTLSLIALRLWCDYSIIGPDALPKREFLMIGTVAWLVLYVIVRSLKKSGRVKA